GRLALLDPLQTLRRAAGELARYRDMAGELRAQPGGGRWHRSSGSIAEVRRDRALERRTGGVDGAEVRGAVRLHVLAHRTVVGDELLEHEVCGIGERLVLALHAAHCIERFARGARSQYFTGNQHG